MFVIERYWSRSNSDSISYNLRWHRCRENKPRSKVVLHRHRHLHCDPASHGSFAIMLNVFHILELPKHGNGFTATSSPTVNILDVGSASPPRKVMRLDADVDIATASRARAKSNGVVNMKILGNFGEF